VCSSDLHFMAATARFPQSLYRRVTPVHLSATGSLAAQLMRDGIAPDTVGHVVLSHLHGDHVGGLGDFPSARICCARAAWEDMTGRGTISALTKGLLPTLMAADTPARIGWIEALPRVALPTELAAFDAGHDLFGDGSMLLVALPGHAAGHYGLWFRDAHGPVFLVADASWSSQAIRDASPPPSLVTAWLGDTAQYRATLSNLHDLMRDAPHVRLVPSHRPEWRPAREPVARA